ncbi:MAG: hypothetical protein ACP5HQ_06085 [Thermoprotei archaeon]
MKFQVANGYLYVTLWDKQVKRPRRFYLGKVEDRGKWEELFRFAKEYSVTREELEEYRELYLDKETNLTKVHYVVAAFLVGVRLWTSRGGSGGPSGSRSGS